MYAHALLGYSSFLHSQHAISLLCLHLRSCCTHTCCSLPLPSCLPVFTITHLAGVTTTAFATPACDMIPLLPAIAMPTSICYYFYLQAKFSTHHYIFAGGTVWSGTGTGTGWGSCVPVPCPSNVSLSSLSLPFSPSTCPSCHAPSLLSGGVTVTFCGMPSLSLCPSPPSLSLPSFSNGSLVLERAAERQAEREASWWGQWRWGKMLSLALFWHRKTASSSLSPLLVSPFLHSRIRGMRGKLGVQCVYV